ncbi:unnamed protein product [Didymodactylos carnosus]|uniref:Uncharacterized protein n=1 Tax=Didymodactylos carnosus TaxID=1234261 RepID=A0A8S2UHP9_9BILA|nr:unnamed protein product [Didymodactylos carnosus]CAF4315810.1 unnamed protein product [Didymodactylos carnosus]
MCDAHSSTVVVTIEKEDLTTEIPVQKSETDHSECTIINATEKRSVNVKYRFHGMNTDDNENNELVRPQALVGSDKDPFEMYNGRRKRAKRKISNENKIASPTATTAPQAKPNGTLSYVHSYFNSNDNVIKPKATSRLFFNSAYTQNLIRYNGNQSMQKRFNNDYPQPQIRTKPNNKRYSFQL